MLLLLVFREGKLVTWPVPCLSINPQTQTWRNTPPGTLEGFYDTISTHGRFLVETRDVPDIYIYMYIQKKNIYIYIYLDLPDM